MADLRTQLADNIRDLAEPYEHAETYELRSSVPDGRPSQQIRVHRVRFPSLLDQLATAIEPSSGLGIARGYESNPTARIDAIDRLQTITKAVHTWTKDLGLTPRAEGLAANMRQLAGTPMTSDQLDDLTRATHRWLTWARITTGWDTPPIRVRGHCPACNASGTIRVRVQPIQALCVDCGCVWHENDGGIDQLAKYIRWANNEPVEAAA